jgi:hypothetical protein
VYSRHKTASTNDGLPEISKMKYRIRIPEPGTTISGFADSKKKNKKFNVQLAQMWKLLAPGVGLGDFLTPDTIKNVSC